MRAVDLLHQYIRRDNETTLKEIKEKLSKTHERSVSLPTISRHLHNHGYRSILPANTPILIGRTETQHTVLNGQRSIKLMISIVQYLQTNHPFTCLEIRFEDGQKIPKVKSNEFRKIVKRFTYGGAISIKGLVGYQTFRTNLTGIYFVDIVKPDLFPGVTMQFKQRWQLQQDNDPKHRSDVAKEFIKNNVSELLECWANSSGLKSH